MRWFVVLLSFAACGSPPAPPAPPARTAPLFEFHSDPWANLHQRLIAEATVNVYWHLPGPIVPLSSAPEWSAAVTGYKAQFEGGKHEFDSPLHRMNITFALAGTSPTLPSTNVDPAFVKLIAPVFPEYMRAQWAVDDARNRAWIASVEPLVAKYAADIAAEYEKRFEIRWPARPIRVEVTQYAGFGGAYTVDDPIFTVMSSQDTGYAAPAALEMLFHEASHGLVYIVAHDLQMAFVAKGKREPDRLDHAIIFYTAGELARRRLGPDYVPYAYKHGLWKRGWEKYEAAMRAHWQPWLDDQIDLQTALARLADAFPE